MENEKSATAVARAMDTATISPYKEAIAYEYLYSRQGMTLAELSRKTVGANKLPTEVLAEYNGMLAPEGIDVVEAFLDLKIRKLPFHVAVRGTTSWPDGIADSRKPTPVFYYCGDLNLLDTPRVSVVGSRKASQDGLARAARLGRELAAAGVTVVSGLAAGVDSAAMRSAVNTVTDGESGSVIGVIGTPIDECYPKQNVDLQTYVANAGLLVSQVPFYRYSVQPFNTKRYYFPERNELMAAISQATVIVEASDTSGTLTQARACLQQKRPLFILRSCLNNTSVTWPGKWAQRPGVFVLDIIDQVIDAIRD